jgi:TonB family protein
MYGAMREHAPSSTRLTGVVSTAAITLALGLALANGLGVYIVKNLPDPLIYVSLPEEKPADPPPVTNTPLETSTDMTSKTLDPLTDIATFIPEDIVVTNRTDVPPRDPPLPPGAGVTPPKAPVLTRARLLPHKQPTYPASDVRKNNQGTSSLEVCLDPTGRVTAASLASSSGHPTLDAAALKWVRDLKFTPAKTNGTPTAVCGHSVVYEWKLDAR